MKFWNFQQKSERTGELFLYGEISDVSWWGDEVTPVQFQKDLAALGELDRLDIYVNSPGGDVFAGFTIYNIIKRCAAEVVAHVDGLAASAASYVCMAADKIVMPKNATMMIHNAAVRVCGNKERLRELVDELERIDRQITDIYTAKTGADAEKVAEMMSAETWMSGEEAFALGFCDELADLQAVACADVAKYADMYRNTPERLMEKPQAPGEPEKPADGGEGQPVTDKDAPALDEQRKTLWNLRKKINGGM